MTARKHDVTTIDGLQNILNASASALTKIRKRDLPWARTSLSLVNSANSLLRTKMKLDKNSR